MNVFLRLAIATILPTILTIIFVFLEKKTSFIKIPNKYRQIIYGVCFGGLAIFGTEWGIPINGAQINVRDAAVLTAGFVFGGPAGIIAGILGGVERYIAVAWGVGTYTQVACSVSTAFAGIYAAFLRKYLFEGKEPSRALALASGLVMETFHLTMVFLTNMSDTTKAIEVVKRCTPTMIPANAIGTMLPLFFNNIFTKEEKDKVIPTITQTIQRWLLICVVIVFLITTGFMFKLQTSIAEKQTKDNLSLALQDVEQNVIDTCDTNLLNVCYNIKPLINGEQSLNDLCKAFNVSEICIVDENGIVTDCNNKLYIGFDMSSGEQSKAFLCLLGDTKEYAQEYGPISSNENVYRKFVGIKLDKGFLQVGLDSSHYQKEIVEKVYTAAENRHIGVNGFVLIANDDGEIFAKPENITINSLNELIGYNENTLQDTLFEASINEDKYTCIYQNIGDIYLVGLIPSSEAFEVRDTAVYVNSFMEILIFAIMFGMIYQLIKSIVVNKIDKVNRSLYKITNGDLDEVVNVKSNQEFLYLSNDINSTVSTLKQYIEEAKKRIEDEIEYAKNIQNSSLPHVFPVDDRFEMFALMDPAKGVGGDFYDFSRSNMAIFNFLVADVSGKGIPGAMFMMRAKSTLSGLTELQYGVEEVFTEGNTRLCNGNDAGMFVTAWQAKIDLNSGIIEYANAGHNPPVIIHNDGTCEYIKGKAGFVLGGMEGIQYKAQEIRLEPNDILFLYTDGVVEANNINKELYGEDRLLDILAKIDKTKDMENLCNEVIKDVEKFVGEAEQFDDITMLAFKYLGK